MSDAALKRFAASAVIVVALVAATVSYDHILS